MKDLWVYCMHLFVKFSLGIYLNQSVLGASVAIHTEHVLRSTGYNFNSLIYFSVCDSQKITQCAARIRCAMFIISNIVISHFIICKLALSSAIHLEKTNKHISSSKALTVWWLLFEKSKINLHGVIFQKHAVIIEVIVTAVTFQQHYNGSFQKESVFEKIILDIDFNDPHLLDSILNK